MQLALPVGGNHHHAVPHGHPDVVFPVSRNRAHADIGPGLFPGKTGQGTAFRNIAVQSGIGRPDPPDPVCVFIYGRRALHAQIQLFKPALTREHPYVVLREEIGFSAAGLAAEPELGMLGDGPGRDGVIRRHFKDMAALEQAYVSVFVGPDSRRGLHFPPESQPERVTVPFVTPEFPETIYEPEPFPAVCQGNVDLSFPVDKAGADFTGFPICPVVGIDGFVGNHEQSVRIQFIEHIEGFGRVLLRNRNRVPDRRKIDPLKPQAVPAHPDIVRRDQHPGRLHVGIFLHREHRLRNPVPHRENARALHSQQRLLFPGDGAEEQHIEAFCQLLERRRKQGCAAIRRKAQKPGVRAHINVTVSRLGNVPDVSSGKLDFADNLIPLVQNRDFGTGEVVDPDVPVAGPDKTVE